MVHNGSTRVDYEVLMQLMVDNLSPRAIIDLNEC